MFDEKYHYYLMFYSICFKSNRVFMGRLLTWKHNDCNTQNAKTLTYCPTAFCAKNKTKTKTLKKEKEIKYKINRLLKMDFVTLLISIDSLSKCIHGVFTSKHYLQLFQSISFQNIQVSCIFALLYFQHIS